MSLKLLWGFFQKKSDVIVTFKRGEKIIESKYSTIDVYVEENIDERRNYDNWVNPWFSYKAIDSATGKILRYDRKSLKSGTAMVCFLHDIFQSKYKFNIYSNDHDENYQQIKSDCELNLSYTYTFYLNSGKVLTVNTHIS